MLNGAEGKESAGTRLKSPPSPSLALQASPCAFGNSTSQAKPLSAPPSNKNSYGTDLNTIWREFAKRNERIEAPSQPRRRPIAFPVERVATLEETSIPEPLSDLNATKKAIEDENKAKAEMAMALAKKAEEERLQKMKDLEEAQWHEAIDNFYVDLKEMDFRVGTPCTKQQEESQELASAKKKEPWRVLWLKAQGKG